MSRVAPSANFRDPVGLLVRMLRSGNRAAYSALIREGLRLAAVPFDMMLSPFEQRCLRGTPESRHPLILIVGAPRSGTTLVYQVLSHYLDVASPDNLSAMFPRSPLTAARLRQRRPKIGRPDFCNYYGQTPRLSDPNDAFHLWNRWLGEDRYAPADSIPAATADQMRRFFDVWTSVFDKPFLNKNNRNTGCIRLLAEQLPHARFVVVRRNPVFVAQSLITARQQVQGDKTVGWGLGSTSTGQAVDPLEYVDDVCRQISSIDHDMNQQLSDVADDRITEITYEGFCKNPQHAIQGIVRAFTGLELNPRADIDGLAPFPVSQQLTLSPPEADRIRRMLGSQSVPASL